MKNWKCTFEAQKGNPGRKNPDFNPVKIIVVQSKFKNGAREVAEEELQLWDREYHEKYRAPVIESATDLELASYNQRKEELLNGLDNGDIDQAEGEDEQSKIDVLEFPVDQNWKVKVGLFDLNGSFSTSMAVVNTKSGGIALGNVERCNVEQYNNADLAINAALERAMSSIVDSMGEMFGTQLDSAVRVLKGYRTLTQAEKLNRIKETILINVGGENLEQQALDSGIDGGVDAMLMEAINACIERYGDAAPEPEECYDAIMLVTGDHTDYAAMSEAIKNLKNPFVMTHSTTSVNFAEQFRVEDAVSDQIDDAGEDNSERNTPISAKGQAMLDSTADESRKQADQEWPKGEPFEGHAQTVGERSPDYVYDTKDLWQSLAYKLLAGSKEQKEATAQQYIEIGQKIEGVFTERNLELMNGEFYSEVASEMIRLSSGPEAMLATLLNLREVRKFVDYVIGHMKEAEESKASINKTTKYLDGMAKGFETEKRLMSEEVFFANREKKHDGKPDEYENELRRRSAEEMKAGEELYVDGFKIIEESISKTDLGADSQEEAKDILCSGVLTLAHQSVAWQLIHALMTGSIGVGNTMTEEVIAAIFTAGCIESYTNNEKPEFDPFNVEKSAYKFYQPLLRRYCAGDLDPESIILEYVNENGKANQPNLEDESDISGSSTELNADTGVDVTNGEALNETIDAPDFCGGDERPNGDDTGYSVDDAVKDLNETLNGMAVGELLILDDIPNEVYHRVNGISSSNIKEEMISSLYRHNRETGEIERVHKKCFDFGNYIHTLLLQPHLAELEYAYEQELPEGGFDSTESLVQAIEKENKNRQPLTSNEALKSLIEAYNDTLPKKRTTTGSKEEIAFIFESLPEEFKLLAPDEKDNATTHKKYIKAYNDSLPQSLKTTGGRDSLLAEISKFNKEFIAEEEAKKPTLPTTGTKKELAERIRSFMPGAVFKHELDDRWKEEVARGLIPVSLEDAESGKRIVASAMANPAIRNWYTIKNDNTACERSYFVKREYPCYGGSVAIILKARLDKEIGDIIVDTKTIELRLDVKAEDAEMAINREIEKRGYHISAAHYLDVTGKNKFFWIFHNKLKGYEWEFIMEANPDHIELGQYEVAEAMSSIARSEVTKEFKAPITQPVGENGAPLPLKSQVSSYANSRLEMFRKMNGEEI